MHGANMKINNHKFILTSEASLLVPPMVITVVGT